jgi:xyloglucan:xyloglucosyl transferase
MAVKARVSPTGLLAAATWAGLLSLVAASALDVPTVAFDERFSPLFGDGNLVRSPDDRSVRLLLDRRSGTCIDVQKARGPLARHEARYFSTTRARHGTN